MRGTHRTSPPARPPILPERLRRIEPGGFAFIPNRFLRDGFFASLPPDELRLYLLLVLAGNRAGLSFYHYDRLCSLLEMTLDGYIAARNALIDKDLIAFDGTRFQVLSLPDRPRFDKPPLLETQDDFEAHDPATARQLIIDDLAGPTD